MVRSPQLRVLPLYFVQHRKDHFLRLLLQAVAHLRPGQRVCLAVGHLRFLHQVVQRLETEYYDILGVKVPSMLIPVMPGRNLAVILETAAINNRQKEMGYNAAKELLTQLGLADDISK